MPVRTAQGRLVRSPADRGRGRHPGADQAGLDRRAVVVAPVHRHPGARLRQRQARPGALVRAFRPGPRSGAGARARSRRGCRGRGAPRTRSRSGSPAYDAASGRARRRRSAAQAALPRQAAGRGDAAGDRGRVRRVRPAAVPRPRDLDMDCSCPDWGFPCKHLSAVLYVLAEAFDDDPFLVLAWRGMAKEALLDALRATGGTADDGDGAAPSRLLDVPDVPFAARLADFYERAPLRRVCATGQGCPPRRPTCCCVRSIRRRSRAASSRSWTSCGPPTGLSRRATTPEGSFGGAEAP